MNVVNKSVLQHLRQAQLGVPHSKIQVEIASSYKLVLKIQDRAKGGKGGGTPHRKQIYWKGGHCTYLIEVGTPHNIKRKSLAVGGLGVV